jgi:hypothetical protein
MINLDMIGQVHLESGSRKDVYHWASEDSFAQAILRRASKRALELDENLRDGYPDLPKEAQLFTTDAEPLYRLGVPVISFLSGKDLDNQNRRDNVDRLIPSRIEQYARLAHECAVEAGNHPESISQMGIFPGGLLPEFPLVRERKNAGLAIIDEEKIRLDDLALRLPELRKAAHSLASRVVKGRFGVAGISEPDLAALRERRDTLIREVRRTKKSEHEKRRRLRREIDRLGGAADILAAALYLDKVQPEAGYFMQRVPEKLADLLRGAQRLGFDAQLEGVVRKNDVTAFSAEVTADRAVQVAREALGTLSRAIGQAVYAAWLPQEAAESEPSIAASSAHELRAVLLRRAKQIAGETGGAQKEVERIARTHALLMAHVSGVKGFGDDWLVRFASANALTEFEDQARVLHLPLKSEAQRLQRAVANDDIRELETAVVEFYDALGRLSLGRTFGSVDAIAKLDAGAVEALTVASLRQVLTRADRATVADAGHDPTVVRMCALGELIEAALSLSNLYRRDGGALKRPVSLKTVKERLDRIESAAAQVEGAEKVQREIAFWSSWLTPFLPLEVEARSQAKLRVQIAQDGLTVIDRLMRSYDHPEIFQAQGALAVLEHDASANAEREFSRAVDKLEKLLGTRACALKTIRARFEEMNDLESVTLGRSQRSGPVSLLAIRASKDGAA